MGQRWGICKAITRLMLIRPIVGLDFNREAQPILEVRALPYIPPCTTRRASECRISLACPILGQARVPLMTGQESAKSLSRD